MFSDVELLVINFLNLFWYLLKMISLLFLLKIVIDWIVGECLLWVWLIRCVNSGLLCLSKGCLIVIVSGLIIVIFCWYKILLSLM